MPPVKKRRIIFGSLGLILLLFVLSFLLKNLPQRQLFQKKAAPEQTATPGNAGDFTPDIIFGKSGFGETVPNQVVGNRVFLPQGVTVDQSTSPNRLYVWDSGNSRILGFSSLGICVSGTKTGQPCTNNLDCPSSTCQIDSRKKADIIIGQPDEYQATCNGDNTQRLPPTASSLCSQRYPYQISTSESPEANNLAVDSNHNLYVVDKWNNRVLKYNDPFTTDQVADKIWGQEDFTKRECNRAGMESGVGSPTQSSLCYSVEEKCSICSSLWGAGLDVDSEENLWVADGANHRVLRFTQNSGYPGGNGQANLVIGQTNFNSTITTACISWEQANPTSPQPRYVPPTNYLCLPKVARFSPHTQQLFVIDWPNQGELYRILIFNPPFSNGMEATEIIYGDNDEAYKFLGQDLSHPNWSYYKLWSPAGLEIDPFIRDAFWITDSNHSRSLYFQKIDGKWKPTKVIGKKDLETTEGYTCAIPNGPPYVCQAAAGGGIGIDSAGNIYLANNNEAQIYRFPAPIPTPGSGLAYPADAIILREQESAFGHMGFNLVSAYGINQANSVLLVNYANGTDQLLADDRYRVLIWDNYQNKSLGFPADHVLFQTDFFSQINTGSLVRQMTQDSQGRIWMAKERAGVYVFQGPVTSLSKPTIIPQILPIKNSPQQITLDGLVGIAYDEKNDALWISDTDNHRVVRIHHPLAEDQREVDLVLGQSDLQSNHANRNVDDREHIPCICASNPCTPEEQTRGCWTRDFECPNMFPDGFAALGHLELDNFGNLYIVDASHEGAWCSNNRLLEYNKEDLERGIREEKVFFQQGELLPKRVYGSSGFWCSASDRTNCEKDKYAQSGKPNMLISVSFTSNNQMLIMSEGNDNFDRIYLLNNPLPECSNLCRVDTNYLPLGLDKEIPLGFSYVFPLSIAQPADSSIDIYGNFVLLDHNWNRVLYFKNPLNQPIPTRGPTPLPTSTSTPITPTSTPPPTGTPRPCPTIIGIFPTPVPGQTCTSLQNRASAAWGSCCNPPEYCTCAESQKYDAVADINKDKKVDIVDVMLISANINDETWCQTKFGEIINPCLPNTLSFKIKFQGISSQRSDKTVRVILRQAGVEKYRFESVNVSSDATGVYSGTTPEVNPGTYDVLVKGSAHLQKNFGNVEINLETPTQDWSAITLRTGDVWSQPDSIYHDNKISAEDVISVLNMWTDFSVTVPANTPQDLNGDDKITDEDIRILLVNYNLPTIYGEK